MPTTRLPPGIIFEPVQEQTGIPSGRRFSNFYASQAPHIGPGWYVFGRNKEKYGVLPDGQGAYVKLCARPDVKPRSHPYYNIKVQRGWRTKREAQAIADLLNSLETV